MGTSPSLNSSIRSILIALGTVGVTRGWWDEAGLETLVDQLIVFGGAAMVIGSAVWGIWAKFPRASEAKQIAADVNAARNAKTR